MRHRIRIYRNDVPARHRKSWGYDVVRGPHGTVRFLFLGPYMVLVTRFR